MNNLLKKMVVVYKSQDVMKSKTRSIEQELELLKIRRKKNR